jgi:hypothetical protein
MVRKILLSLIALLGGVIEMGCGGGCASNSCGSLDIKDEELKKKTEMHPCYSEGGHKYARMHLPVIFSVTTVTDCMTA